MGSYEDTFNVVKMYTVIRQEPDARDVKPHSQREVIGM